MLESENDRMDRNARFLEEYTYHIMLVRYENKEYLLRLCLSFMGSGVYLPSLTLPPKIKYMSNSESDKFQKARHALENAILCK